MTPSPTALAGPELDRQLANLRAAGYPAPRAAAVPLAPSPSVAAGPGAAGRIPFVIVPGGGVPREAAVARVVLEGRSGFTTMEAADLARFGPIEDLDIPPAPYLLLDVDTGGDLLDVTPAAALEAIRSRGRSPLTIDEGIALVTQYPDILRARNCFSLLGSRAGDRRVTALWMSGRRPRLGWCWAGNPHSWLGSASCAGRIALS